MLEGVSLQLQGAGLHHLAAPNGIGKSTLFEVLAGYLRPMAGTVEVAGRRVVAGKRVRELRLQRSAPTPIPGITMRDHFHLVARRYGRSLDGVLALAGELGLDEHVGKPPEAWSTGTRKKVWFVVHATGTEPVWCLDEPFDGVDVGSAAVMTDHLLAAAAHGLVVVTAHILPPGVEVDGPQLAPATPFVVRRVRRA